MRGSIRKLNRLQVSARKELEKQGYVFHTAVRSVTARGLVFFFFQAEDGIRDLTVTGVQTCALPIWLRQIAFFPKHRASMSINLANFTGQLGGHHPPQVLQYGTLSRPRQLPVP